MSAHVLSDCRELIFQLAIAPRCNYYSITFLNDRLMQLKSPFALARPTLVILLPRDSSLTPSLFHNEPNLRHLYHADREQ